MEPGIYPKTTREQYDAIPGINISRLKKGLQSMAHLRAEMDGAADNGDTPAMAFGRAVHCRILEPAVYAAEYAVAPAGDNANGTASKTSKDGKAAWSAWERLNAGKTALPPADFARVEAMAAMVRSHDAASRLLGLDGNNEVAIVWKDVATGLLCKGRVDRLDAACQWVIDYKTTGKSAAKDALQGQIHQYGYHIQAAFYCDGIHAITGGAYPSAAYIWQETYPPYAVACSVMPDDSLDIGRREYRRLLAELAACRKSGTWPGYPQMLQEIGLPAWVVARAERIEEVEL